MKLLEKLNPFNTLATAPRGRFKIKLNVTYVLKDKDGNNKNLFKLNSLGSFLLKKGIISPFNKSFLFGSYTDQLNITNLITTAGKAGIASRINGDGSEAAFTYIAVGTGTTAADVGDTTLETELATSGLSRAAGTASRVTTDTTNDTAQLVKSFSVTGTAAVTESGVLNAASSGVLLARQVFSAINVVNTDTLQITWKFDVD